MAWSWGNTTLAFEEEPVEGAVNFIRERVWVFANPRMANRTLKQKLHNKSLEGTVRLRLSEATMLSLQAEYEGDVAVLHTNPRPPYSTGVMMLITKFTAIWNPSVPGEDPTIYEYDCVLEMMED